MIIYFSGTGNSRFVAHTLGKELNERVTEITDEELTSHPLPDERIIWVFPIYAWGLPRIIRHTADKLLLPDTSSFRNNYMVATCGDDIGEAHLMWRKMITGKGHKAVATFSVTMPNTYVLLPGFDVDPEDIKNSKLIKASERIKSIAQKIESGWEGDDVTTGRFKWMKTAWFYPFFMRHLMSPKPFHASSETCIRCGRCINKCPMNNITWGEHRYPEWHDNCEMCLACYHCCPSHSVCYGNRTSKKGQYMFPPESDMN